MSDVVPRKKYQRPAKRPIPVRSKVQPTGEEQRVIFDRIEGFIRDDGGRYTIRHLMAEAYLQGMRDTLQCMESRDG